MLIDWVHVALRFLQQHCLSVPALHFRMALDRGAKLIGDSAWNPVDKTR